MTACIDSVRNNFTLFPLGKPHVNIGKFLPLRANPVTDGQSMAYFICIHLSKRTKNTIGILLHFPKSKKYGERYSKD